MARTLSENLPTEEITSRLKLGFGLGLGLLLGMGGGAIFLSDNCLRTDQNTSNYHNSTEKNFISRKYYTKKI